MRRLHCTPANGGNPCVRCRTDRVIPRRAPLPFRLAPRSTADDNDRRKPVHRAEGLGFEANLMARHHNTDEHHGSCAKLDAELTHLFRAVRKGCTHSFSRLYAATSPQMLRVVLRIMREQRDAEEVLQEVYVKVWNSSHQFDEGKGHVVAWLTGISQHSAIDSLRRQRSRPPLTNRSVISEDEPYLGLASREPQPCERLQHTQAVAAVRDCLRDRPSNEREALLLAYYDGLSHREIAAKLGRPLGTVKSWLNRSLADMRPALDQHR